MDEGPWGPGVDHVIGGRYRILSQLGKGGMGAVWKAEHLELGTFVALKVMAPSIAANPDALARFKREAQAAAGLRSRHVVQILDYGVDGTTPYIVMELLDGEGLDQRLRRVGTLDPITTARVLGQVAVALSRAHDAGVIHRDLKPSNIFLALADDEEIAKVLDFGVAKSRRLAAISGTDTETGALLGTPSYMSPEQAAGHRDIDHRCDIWAFSVIAFQCLVGERPFGERPLVELLVAICTEAPPPPSALAAVPRGFDEWFARGIHRDRDRRFSNIKEAASLLAQVCGLPAPTLLREPGPRESVANGPFFIPGLPAPPTATELGFSGFPEAAGGGPPAQPSVLSVGLKDGRALMPRRRTATLVALAIAVVGAAAGIAFGNAPSSWWEAVFASEGGAGRPGSGLGPTEKPRLAENHGGIDAGIRAELDSGLELSSPTAPSQSAPGSPAPSTAISANHPGSYAGSGSGRGGKKGIKPQGRPTPTATGSASPTKPDIPSSSGTPGRVQPPGGAGPSTLASSIGI